MSGQLEFRTKELFSTVTGTKMARKIISCKSVLSIYALILGSMEDHMKS